MVSLSRPPAWPLPSEEEGRYNWLWTLLGVVGATAFFFLFILPAAVSMLGTGGFVLFPNHPTKEERYHNINHFLEEIDYTSGGVILEEAYDGNPPTPLNEASFIVIYQGTEAFKELKPRVEEATGGVCQETVEQLNCWEHIPTVRLLLTEEGNTKLQVSESGPGL